MRIAARIRNSAVLVVLLSVVVSPMALADDPLPEPCTGPHDWIQLNSAEWLRGDLRRMRTRSLEFQSKKLKNQSLKWKDVLTVCMAGVARFVREDQSVVQGIGEVHGDTVSVLAATGEIDFPRSELLAILPGPATELERWGFKGSLGGDFNTGNTNQSSLNMSLIIRREDSVSRGELGFYGSFASANNVRNVGQQRVEFKLDYFLSRRIYATVINLPVFSDEFQNIAVRATPSTGFGWRVLDLDSFEWDLEAAAGYQYLEYISVFFSQPKSVNDGIIRASTSFKWKITSDLDLTVQHDTVIVVSNIGQSTNHTRAVLSFGITDLLDLEITAVHDRTWEPAPDSLGQVPEKDDLKMIFGFGIEMW